MPKYIRTKDWIYELFDDKEKNHKIGVTTDGKSAYELRWLSSYNLGPVLKQSDSLETLFDYAVVVSKEESIEYKPIVTKVFGFKELYLTFTNSIIYGAIFVPEKGIMLVAEIINIDPEDGSIEWSFNKKS